MAQPEVSLAGKRCLVLDDEFLIAMDIQQILENAGAEVVCAGTAVDALAAVRNGGNFDLAVLDVKLGDPTRTSLSVATALAEKKVPFVFLTGMRRDELRHTPFAGAPVVEKPYETSVLWEAIMRALNGGSR
jgi:CheY-like chemotaxis protein